MIWLILNFFSTYASLTNLWISVNDSLQINLLDYLAPINSQLSLSGSYNVSGITAPTLSQPFNQTASYSTSAQGSNQALTVSNNILYTSYASGVYSYNITNPQTIVTPTKIQYAKSIPKYLDSMSLPTGNFLVSVEGSVVFRVVNLTSNSEITSLEIMLTIPNLNNAVFYNDGKYIWTMLTNSTNMMILQTDLLVAFKTVSYLNLTVANFNNFIQSFENFVFYQGLYYACMQSIVFNISTSLNGAAAIPYTAIYDRKLKIGSFVECSLNGLILSYSTTEVLLIYSLPNFDFIAEHKGQYSNVTSGLGFVLSNSGTSFTVMSNNAVGLAQTFTGFGSLYGWFLLDETTVLVNTANAFTFYSLYIPTLSFSPALVNSTFSGAITQNGTSSSVILTASNAPTILQYTTATELRDYTIGFNYGVFIPLSNFIKGSNLTFTLGTNNGVFTPISPFNSVSKVSPSLENPNNNFLASLSKEEKELDQTLLSTIALSDYFIYVYSNVIKVAYYIAGVYKSTISINARQGGTISCAAALDSVLVIENYFVPNSKYNISYDFYNLNGQYITNLDISSFSTSNINYPSSKMVLPNNQSIFTLNNKCVLSILFDSNYAIYNTRYETGMNLADITVCNGDVCGAGTNSFYYVDVAQFSTAIYTLPKNYLYFKILAIQDFVLVAGDQYVYQYPISKQPFWNNRYTLLSQPCNTTDPTLFLSSSQQFLSIQCQGLLNIYDIYAEPYLNPYLSIPFSSNLYLTSDTLMPSYAYTIASGVTTSYLLCPTFSTSLVVDNQQSCNYWGFYDTSFNSTGITSTLSISAANAFGNISQSASITILNSNYILPNKTFSPTSSSLTSGTIDVKKSSFSSVVPTNALIGNNITYSLNVNGASYFPQSTCVGYTSFCIESRAYNSVTIFPYLANEFSVSGRSIAAMTNSSVYVYPLNESSTSAFVFSCDTCSQIILLSNGTSVVGYSDSIGPSIFFTTTLGGGVSLSSSSMIDSEPLWIISDEYKGSTYIYEYDGVSLLGLQLVKFNYQEICFITSINFQGAFNPVAAYYWSDSSTLVVDQFTGIFEVQNSDNSTAVLLFSYNSSFSVAGTLIYDDVLALFTSTADVYFLNFTNLKVINTFMNPTPSAYYQLYSKATFSSETNLLAYLVSTTSNSVYIRVLNCSEMLVLIDNYIGVFPQQTSPIMGFLQNSTSIQAYYLVNQAIQTLNIRSEINVYVQSFKQKYHSVMQLVASSGETLLALNSVNITYPYSSDSSGFSIGSIYKKWWFWLVILSQASLV